MLFHPSVRFSNPMSNPEISVVSAMHNEAGNVVPLYDALAEVMKKMGREYEIIFVNDASRDETLEQIKKIKARDPRFHYCDLEQNVGENWAFLAGFSKARGNIIVTIDGDFQNNPRFIPDLVRELEKGYRAVSGWRKNRVGGFFDRILPSLVANFLIYLVSGVRVHDCGCGLRAFRREVVEGKYVPKGFMNRFAPVCFGVKADEFSEVIVEDRMRRAGRSHYGLERVFIVFNDLLALPFALRGPERMRRIFLYIILIFAGVLALLSGVWAIRSGWAWIGFVLALAFFLASVSIYWNLGRFVDAARNPKFRIKEFA